MPDRAQHVGWLTVEEPAQRNIRSDGPRKRPEAKRGNARGYTGQSTQQPVVQRSVVFTRERTLEERVAHHRRGVGERCVCPAMASDIDKSAEVVDQLSERPADEAFWADARGEAIGRSLERAHATAKEQKLPRSLRRDPQKLRRLRQATASSVPAQSIGRLRRRLIDSDELVERCREPFAERRHAKHRVDVRQVVVHPRPVDADDPGEAPVHRAQSAPRHAEGEPEIAEVVVVTRLRDRIEQRRNCPREILVDVGIRPQHIGPTIRVAISPGGCRDGAGLENPEHAVLVDCPLDVLSRAQLGFQSERKP